MTEVTKEKWFYPVIVSAGLSALLGLGTLGYQSLQSQVDRNNERIYELRSSAITKTELAATKKDIMEYVQLRFDTLQSAITDNNRKQDRSNELLLELVKDKSDRRRE